MGKTERHRIIADPQRCAGCLTCMLRCGFRFEKQFNLASSRIEIFRTIDQPNEYEIRFAEGCDGCGLCVEYCPYDALKREKTGRQRRDH